MFDRSYQVKINTNTSEGESAILTPASQSDMPVDWSCDWVNIWSMMDSDCQAIIKLVYQNQIWGLMRYGIYPYPGTPNFVEIEHLEANPITQGKLVNRLVSPVGKWLIWYAIKGATSTCTVVNNVPLVVLVSLEKAMKYYRDIIEMEYVGETNLAPGEEGYAFRFSEQQAIAYSQKHESKWGSVTIIDP